MDRSRVTASQESKVTKLPSHPVSSPSATDSEADPVDEGRLPDESVPRPAVGLG